MHLSDTSSIEQLLKRHSCLTTELQKIHTENTTILEHQNNKQKLQILRALHIRNIQPKLRIMSIYAVLKSDMEREDAQRVSAQITTILPTTGG